MSNIIVSIESNKLEPEKLREMINAEGCGSIISFVGITRGNDKLIKIKELVFDAWEERLPLILNEIAEKSILKFGIQSVVLAHRIGSVGPMEPIVCIHVSSIHRTEGFEACSWLIDELKSQAPLWKKEVREDGIVWKQGLG
jgi:molybdopterin synthase catalytic subunit|tara:strand:+ start:954 stop:1376 length:423 start_codon:yes stop_codon:yes gene_type:complete